MGHPVVIGLDLGTTACKAVALGRDGVIHATAAGDCPLKSRQPGWAEQDAPAHWRTATAVLRRLTGQVPARDLVGLSLSGAMHSLLPLAENGAPLAPATTWADSRATVQARWLCDHADAAALYRRTGCPVQATYFPARLRWWHEQAPRLARRTRWIVGLKDWVLWRLTGGLATECSVASATGLLDIHRRQWDDEALELAMVRAAQLPRLASPQEVIGRITRTAARATGLPAGLPVVAGASDGALANVGAGAAAPGQTVITVGTSGAIRMITDRPRVDAGTAPPCVGQRTWCYALWDGRWLAGGAINNGGLTLQWVRERFYRDVPGAAGYAALDADAATIAPGADGLLLLPYFTGERSPYWDAAARGAFHGLTLRHTRAHLARAAQEAVAFCLADVWQVVRHEPRTRSTLKRELRAVRLTGGITRSPTWCQIIADVLNVPVAPVETADASALGAAVLGHWALKTVDDLGAIAVASGAGEVFAPDPVRTATYARCHARFQECGRRLVFGR